METTSESFVSLRVAIITVSLDSDLPGAAFTEMGYLEHLHGSISQSWEQHLKGEREFYNFDF